ncbi:MAG TPA: hypothetical protein PKE69_22440, partial [Pyrinomonadaceae bacterium]|nr:hypothetical protein [Pyrinomonadaceae bacterium]
MSIRGSVGAKKANGQKSENYPEDVFYVRVWLNRQILWNPIFKKAGFKKQLSTIIAIADEKETIQAIKAFQMYILKIQNPPGRIDPSSRTMEMLEFSGTPGYLNPDDFATKEAKTDLKLIAVSKSNLLLLDLKGEIRCMVDMLLNNPNVDDRYLVNRFYEGESQRVDPRMEQYIKDANPSIPPPPINFEYRLKNRLINEEEKYLTTESFFKFIVRLAMEIHSGYTAHFTFTGKHTLSLSPSNNGQYAASKNVEDWFKARFADKNSIYSCFPSLLTETRSYGDITSLDDWKGYW